MKKYTVSFASLVPVNYEVVVEAEHEAEAIRKAEAGEWEADTFTEPDYTEVRPDYTIKEEILMSEGVHVEEFTS